MVLIDNVSDLKDYYLCFSELQAFEVIIDNLMVVLPHKYKQTFLKLKALESHESVYKLNMTDKELSHLIIEIESNYENNKTKYTSSNRGCYMSSGKPSRCGWWFGWENI